MQFLESVAMAEDITRTAPPFLFHPGCRVIWYVCCSRVGFGVTTTNSMLNSLVAIALPASSSNPVGFYKTNPTAHITPVVVRAKRSCFSAVDNCPPPPPVPFRASFPTCSPSRSWSPLRVAGCAQFNPGFASFELTYSQDAATTRLNVVRPIAHPTWPIKTDGPTNVVFATGNGNTMAYHSANRGVCLCRVQCCARDNCGGGGGGDRCPFPGEKRCVSAQLSLPADGSN